MAPCTGKPRLARTRRGHDFGQFESIEIGVGRVGIGVAVGGCRRLRLAVGLLLQSKQTNQQVLKRLRSRVRTGSHLVCKCFQHMLEVCHGSEALTEFR